MCTPDGNTTEATTPVTNDGDGCRCRCSNAPASTAATPVAAVASATPAPPPVATATASASANATTTADDDAPWWPFVVALIAGLLAAWWWASQDFTQVIRLGKSAVALNYEYANQWWAALIAGTAAFAIVRAILPWRNYSHQRR